MPNTASFAARLCRRRARELGGRARRGRGTAPPAPPIDVVARYWFNPELTSRNFLVPGSMAIVLTMVGTLLTALVVAREWERGTMEAMMATPISMAKFIATKVVPYFLLGLGSALVCTIFAITVFGVPFRGSPLALLLIVSGVHGARAGPGAVHFGRDQEPVRREPDRAADRVHAGAAAVRLPVRDQLDAAVDPAADLCACRCAI